MSYYNIMDNINFGKRIYQLLEERGITDKQFLKDTGVKYQQLYDWTNKGSMPSVIKALNVAEYFNLSVEQLIYGKTTDTMGKIAENLQSKLNTIRQLCN